MTEETTTNETNKTEKKDSVTFTIKKDNLWKYSTFILAAVVLIGAIAIFAGGNGTPTGAVVGANQPTGGTIPTAQANVEATEDDHFIFGSLGAKVEIIEYSDFECPFCQRLYSDAVTQIKSEFGDNPDVNFVYRHLPLTSIHFNAQKAAEATECAAEQGKFSEMHDALFESGVAGGVPAFKGYASGIEGIDTAQFDECLDSGETAGEVAEDLASAQSVGAQGTPTTFINGQKVGGAQPGAVFIQLIEAELAK